jgi:kynurenine 3-monooxygenase
MAGSLLAVMLANRGFEITIYEKRGDMRREAISAGRSINLALAARGIKALSHAGLIDLVKPLMLPMPGRMLHDEQGNLKYQPYSRNADEINHSISRVELNKALMSAAKDTGRVRIRFHHSVEHVDLDNRRLRILDQNSGESFDETRGPVLAADGAGSQVRKTMQEKLRIHSQEDMLDHAYKELNIPGTADGGFRIEKEALHIWPRGGFMLIALPNPDGSFTVTLFMQKEGERSFASIRNEEALRAFFKKYFPDTLDLIPDLERDFFTNPTGALGTVRCEPWHHRDAFCLLGDAAHAIVPFHGQGMNCAFEDCVVLDDLVEKHGADWGRIFEEFTRARKDNAEAIADMALENYIEMRDSVRDPKFHLRKQVEFLLERERPDRFIPRYSMVMFHPEISYAQAYRRGHIQREIVDELLEASGNADAVDLERARQLVEERLG